MTGAGLAQASKVGSLLSVFVGALMLVVVTIPVISSNLNTLSLSEFEFRVKPSVQTCATPTLCLRFFNGKVERAASGYEISMYLEGLANVYELAKAIDSEALKVVLADGQGHIDPPILRPKYDLYFNFDKVDSRIPLALQIPDPPPPTVTLGLEYAGTVSPYVTLDISRNDAGELAKFMVQLNRPAQVHGYAALLILLLVLFTCFAESRGLSGVSDGSAVFAGAVAVRWLAIAGAGMIASPAICLLVAFGVLLPWLAMVPPHFASGGRAIRTVMPLWQQSRPHGRATKLELFVLFMAIALFVYLLTLNPSFRWSIFEERDFLEARRVLSQLTFPIYGPELLLGGHTVGSALYLLLAPVVALWNDPQALLLLNRLLFVGMVLILWRGLRGWVGPAGALFAVFALIASERIVALSYWPIHPNFSLFFAFTYTAVVIRGAVAGRRGWLIFSGLLLGVLTQLHFSYFLLLPGHAVLVLLANGIGDRWTKPLAILAVFIPLLPFVVIDAIQGFPNILEIAQRPRFHPIYPSTPFDNPVLLPLVFGWATEIGGPLAGILSMMTMLLIGLGVAVGVGSAVPATKGVGLTPPLSAAALFTIPAVELMCLGMGYNTRHTLAMVAPLFMLAGFGFAAALHVLPSPKRWIGVAIVLPLLAVLGWRATNSAAMTQISRSEGEWAIDYRSREAIAKDLAGRLGMTPLMYASRTYWWWVGWSIDPEVYADIYHRMVPSPRAQKSSLTADQYVLITSAAELPPFLQRVFMTEDSRRVTEMYVHLAKPKGHVVGPSPNTDTGVRLHPFLEQIDQLRLLPEGFAHIGHGQFGTSRGDLFLGTLADGRIKILIGTEQDEVEGRSRLRWCVDLPSLNGHYQEIKTIWRPRLQFLLESGPAVEEKLASDVLGSLLYKAPRCGEVRGSGTGLREMNLAIDGLFDQSFMLRPDLLPRQWPLDPAAPIRETGLSSMDIAAWITTRFDR